MSGNATSVYAIIELLEKNSNPGEAYFSYTTDDSGEYGAIRANKEGLRLYAAELLKKSLEMEEKRDGKSLCFSPYEWLVSDAGYDLIRAVRPEYANRQEIITRDNPGFQRKDNTSGQPASKKWFGLFSLVSGSLLSVAASLKSFC